MIYNKKAQTATILIFIVAIISSITTLFVLASSNSDFNSQSLQLSQMVTEIEYSQDHILSLSKIIAKQTIQQCAVLSCTPEQLKSDFKTISLEKDFQLSQTGNFFGEIRNSNFNFFVNENNQYQLEIPNIKLQSQKQANKFTRSLTICMLFNEEGKYVKDC